jgi:hypothetical protein
MQERKEQEIRRRAYEIWESEERPVGEDLRHWMQASSEFAAGAEKDDRDDLALAQAAGGNEEDVEITTGEKPARQTVKSTEGP